MAMILIRKIYILKHIEKQIALKLHEIGDDKRSVSLKTLKSFYPGPS